MNNNIPHPAGNGIFCAGSALVDDSGLAEDEDVGVRSRNVPSSVPEFDSVNNVLLLCCSRSLSNDTLLLFGLLKENICEY